MEIQRYGFGSPSKHFGPAPSGNYVKAEDFDRVTAERDALQQLLNARDEEVERLRACLTGCGTWPMRKAARKAWPDMPGDGVDHVLSCALSAALEN